MNLFHIANRVVNNVSNTMDNLFIVHSSGKTYLVHGAKDSKEAYNEVHDFLGGDIKSFETEVRQVEFPPGSNAVEIS